MKNTRLNKSVPQILCRSDFCFIKDQISPNLINIYWYAIAQPRIGILQHLEMLRIAIQWYHWNNKLGFMKYIDNIVSSISFGIVKESHMYPDQLNKFIDISYSKSVFIGDNAKVIANAINQCFHIVILLRLCLFDALFKCYKV